MVDFSQNNRCDGWDDPGLRGKFLDQFFQFINTE